jgi:HD-GYP domain-containing protein (c-di-GMP phosphodiesterase class II)
MVRHHQERFDGLTTGAFPGYPDGLAGREIPLGARIIAVVDAFDAMTSDRPYRRAVGLERAKQALREEAGHQFDPRVVETFLRLLEERGWESEPAADEDDEEDAAAS